MKAKDSDFARMGLAILIGGLVATWNVAQSDARAEVDLSVGLEIHSPSEFHSPLAPYGAWVDVGHYGRCWHPAHLAMGWRPYTIGHWEWTDCGWYWVSDEPWAWACYHYGYWVPDPEYGWVWVPGTDWAPAWVVWRESPDYIGWAPCGPGGFAVADTSFVFVDVHHFHDRLEPRSLVFNDPRILERTRVVRDFHRETRDIAGVRRTVFANPGPGVAPIQRATGARFTPRPVVELARQTPVPEAARRSLAQPKPEPARQDREAVPQTGREQQRLYREAPAQPPPTGRQEQRLYRESPHSRPAPRNERPVSPNQVERGRNEVPPRQEPPPRVAPEPAPRQAPAVPHTPPPGREREKDRNGQ